MRVMAEYDAQAFPPLLRLSIFGAPHRRMHIEVIAQYRVHLYEAVKRAGARVPIEVPIDLNVIFIDPTSTDMGNLYLALEMAMDGGRLGRASVLMDDSLVHGVKMMKLYPQGQRERAAPILHLRHRQPNDRFESVA